MILNFALIGTGGIVKGGHVRALAEVSATQLWSVLSRDFNRAKEFAAAHGAASLEPAFDSLSSLLSDPRLDAVIIATPDKLHRDQAVAAAEAGKHVLLEKPMATDVEGADAILKACQQADVQLGLCYRLRWHPVHRKIIRMAHSGEFGELRHVRVLWSINEPDSSNWRASTELGRWWSLAAVGTHCIDLARWTLTPSMGEIRQLKSVINREVWGGPHDETAVLALQFESGATAEICSSVLFNSSNRFEIYGSDGYAICEDTFGRDAAGRAWTNTGQVHFTQVDPFVGLLDDFAHSVMNNRSPEVDGVEGAKNTRLLFDAIDS